MITTTLTAAVAREHINDLQSEAAASRAAAQLPARDRHRSVRLRLAWWMRITARTAAPRSA